MQELIKLLLGTALLALGFPLGNFLAQKTKEELKQGRKWFRILVAVSLLGGVLGLILGDDILMFSFFFIAVVTSRSMKK